MYAPQRTLLFDGLLWWMRWNVAARFLHCIKRTHLQHQCSTLDWICLKSLSICLRSLFATTESMFHCTALCHNRDAFHSFFVWSIHHCDYCNLSFTRLLLFWPRWNEAVFHYVLWLSLIDFVIWLPDLLCIQRTEAFYPRAFLNYFSENIFIVQKFKSQYGDRICSRNLQNSFFYIGKDNGVAQLPLHLLNQWR